MNNVCEINQNITDKFKHLDDVQYQQEYNEHCRKMSIIDSYEEEIKDVLFLSSGCVDVNSHSYKQYGLGLSPDYIDLKWFVYKLQCLKSKNGSYKDPIDFCERGDESEYTEYLLSLINKYSKEFYNKEYFTRWEGELFSYELTLVSKCENWKQEYLRNGDTLHSWKGFTIATLAPIFGWYFILYSMYEAVRLYFKHKGECK